MNCLYHDKEVIAISLDELNENNSRLLCVECLLEDKHFDKMKWTDF